MKRPAASLQARALTWLAQREQSRSELRRKLLRLVAQAQRRESAADAEVAADNQNDTENDADTDVADAAVLVEAIDALLDRLQAQGLLSEERFIESRVRVRAPGLGARRIQAELAQHDLKLPPQTLQALRDSEFERARQLWRRKFGLVPTEPREHARQMRFLAARGFSAQVIRAVLADARKPCASR